MTRPERESKKDGWSERGRRELTWQEEMNERMRASDTGGEREGRGGRGVIATALQRRGGAGGGTAADATATARRSGEICGGFCPNQRRHVEGTDPAASFCSRISSLRSLSMPLSSISPLCAFAPTFTATLISFIAAAKPLLATLRRGGAR